MPNNNLNMQQLIEMRVQKIYEKMNWCIKENNLIDISKLASSFKFDIIEHNELPDLLNGVITCNGENNQMAINNNLSKGQKRYSIAYLLSSYLLYYQGQDFLIFKHNNCAENFEISYMARVLLIPSSTLEHAYSDISENIKILSNIFEVPDNVMEQRIQDLKKIKRLNLVKK